jgi:hypothetical protein
LVFALFCSASLLAASASQAAVSTGAVSARCFSQKSFRSSSTVCEYRFEQPFSLKGYSKGGSSTLSYTVQCGNSPTWPLKSAQIDHRVWFRRSLTVRGSFSVLGAKGTPLAAKRCAAKGKAALLTVKLKMSKRVTRTNLAVTMDSSLPWGK